MSKVVSCDNLKCRMKINVHSGIQDNAMPVRLSYKGDFEFCSMKCLMNWCLQQPQVELEAIKL